MVSNVTFYNNIHILRLVSQNNKVNVNIVLLLLKNRTKETNQKSNKC